MQDLYWQSIPRARGTRGKKRPTVRREIICNSVTFKHFVELRNFNIGKTLKSRNRRLAVLEESIDNLTKVANVTKQKMLEIHFARECAGLRLKRARIDVDDFALKKVIGVGAFGKVIMAKGKTNNQLYAIKSLKKSEVLTRNQAGHIIAERDILAECESVWVVKLFHTFQDDGHLYFVMEYVPGGDLMNLLCRESIFSEQMSRFYTAELILALEYVHDRGFIHRDIKPDNIMLTEHGHIKLTDFGLCTGFRWTHNSKYYRPANIPIQDFPGHDGYYYNNEFQTTNEKKDKSEFAEIKKIAQCKRKVARSLVGTPNYISPEVLNLDGHTRTCDFWSVGVILFEMVCGYPPFYEKTARETQMKIINFRKTFAFPKDLPLQHETRSIITSFISERERRLGVNGVREIKSHPFFHGLQWDKMLQSSAPFKPKFKSDEDTSNFDLPNTCVDQLTLGKQVATMERHMYGDHAFLEFTFRRMYDGDKRSQLRQFMHFDKTTSEFVNETTTTTSQEEEDSLDMDEINAQPYDPQIETPTMSMSSLSIHQHQHQQQQQQQQDAVVMRSLGRSRQRQPTTRQQQQQQQQQQIIMDTVTSDDTPEVHL